MQKNKTSQYIISFTLLILGLFIINAFALQKILSDIFCNIPGKILNRNISVICINVLFKDFAIVALFSMLHVYEQLSIRTRKREKLFAEDADIISIIQKNNKIQILYTHNISYVQSRRNVLTLNMVNGQTISQNPDCKTPLIAYKTGSSVRTVERIIQQLREENLITLEGGRRFGGYVVK